MSARAVVLVHGAWMDAGCWDRVRGLLAAQGDDVRAVNLPGHGADQTSLSALSLDAYVDAVIAALPDGAPALLVGHSMAGMVISAVAERVPHRVSGLLYLAAYLPQSGESLYQISQTDADSVVPRYWRQDDPAAYSPAYIDAAGIVEVFAADASPADQAQLVASHRAEALGPLGTPVSLTAERWGRVPRAYIHTTRDRAVSYALQQRMVAAAPGTTVLATLETSHVPMLTAPDAVVVAIRGWRP